MFLVRYAKKALPASICRGSGAGSAACKIRKNPGAAPSTGRRDGGVRLPLPASCPEPGVFPGDAGRQGPVPFRGAAENPSGRRERLCIWCQTTLPAAAGGGRRGARGRRLRPLRLEVKIFSFFRLTPLAKGV